MIDKVNDFIESWTQLSASTLKLFNVLTDASLDQQVCEGYRTIGRIAWHLVQTLPEMMNQTGLAVEGPDEEQFPPKTLEEIIKEFTKASDNLIREVKSKWDDETLSEIVEMYGITWTKGKAAQAFMMHHVHHIGQLTVLMRQAGLKVPGVYGPAKEEWGLYGMEAPSI